MLPFGEPLCQMICRRLAEPLLLSLAFFMGIFSSG